MRVTYDPKVDIMTIRLKDGHISESDELQEGIIADYDPEGQIVGLEILDASAHGLCRVPRTGMRAEALGISRVSPMYLPCIYPVSSL